MTKGEFYFPSANQGDQVHVQEWKPEGTPRGVVQIVHGICEYVGRYERYAKFLTDHGFYVVGDDHLGHGLTAKSPEELGFTASSDGWMKMVDDLETLRQITREKYPNLPYVMLGHSMGSFLARTYLCRYPGNLQGCILSGTGQNPSAVVAAGKGIAALEQKRLGDHGRSKLLQALAFGSYNRKFKPIKTGNEWLSRDETVHQQYAGDPLTSFFPTTTLFRDMMGGLQYIWSLHNLNEMDKDCPILLYSGDMDPVGGQGRQVRQVYERFLQVGCRDVTLKLYPGGRHEMHNELNYQEVFQDVLHWREEKVLE